jgi:hypothetical protein
MFKAHANNLYVLYILESLQSILAGNLWSADTELRVLNWMSYAFIVNGAAVLGILSLGIQAPYGRYTSSAWGPPVNARIAWFFQEVPALVVPLLFWYFDSHQSLSWASKVLLSGFIVHYIHR